MQPSLRACTCTTSACGCRHAAAGIRLQAHRLGAVRRHRRRRGQAATGVRGRLGDAQPGRLLLQRLTQQRLRARRPQSMRRHDMPRTLVGLHGRRQPWHRQRRLRPSLPCPRAAHRRGRGGAGSAGGTDGSALALQMLVDQRARWRQRWPRVVSSVSSQRCAGQPALGRPRVQLALGLRLSREEPKKQGGQCSGQPKLAVAVLRSAFAGYPPPLTTESPTTLYCPTPWPCRSVCVTDADQF